jgi:3-carboxy-cis,cis-muconate cycloisomerase
MTLLRPGSQRAAGLVDDAAVVAAMLRVEAAWPHALADAGALDAADADALDRAVHDWPVDLDRLRAGTEAAGNPVVPLVAALRESVADERLARLIHRGLTSQDVLDTALVLIARNALRLVCDSLDATASALAELADHHRDTVMAGRTLTQHAVPITFGLKAARWLSGVLDARDEAGNVVFPVQCGGAAGTLALVAETGADPVAVARAFADRLGLTWPGLPWHTTRTPVTRIGEALAGTCAALGVIAADVALLSRPEIAELHEETAPGRGGSSTMPHKRNPVLSVLVRSAALQAPQLEAQLRLAAGLAVDERPDGAWHSEWPAFLGLLELTVVATSQAAELVSGLEVDAEAITARARAAADVLLAERGTPGDPATYLGAADVFVDAVLARFKA